MLQEKLLNWLDVEGPKRGLNNDRDIALRAGISPSVISKARTGFQPIGWDACVKLAKPFGVSGQSILVLGGHLDAAKDYFDPETEELIEKFAQLDEPGRQEILMILRYKLSAM